MHAEDEIFKELFPRGITTRSALGKRNVEVKHSYPFLLRELGKARTSKGRYLKRSNYYCIPSYKTDVEPRTC